MTKLTDIGFSFGGHYVLQDGSLPYCADHVRQLLENFVPGNTLSASLEPGVKSPNDNGITAYYSDTRSPDTLFLTTSGTTGTPKVLEKDNMSAYMQNKKGSGSQQDSWILTFHPYRWAGISVIAHVIKTGAFLYVPDDFSTKSILKRAEECKTSHISLTPSMFRKFLIEDYEGLKKCSFTQITFGGELANQVVLDQAKLLFPEARITHTYGSTEHGDIAASSDGREGFPQHKFKNFTLTDEGELMIDGKPTGDLWQLRVSRYYFQGRLTDVVNVGGNKIALSFIENQIMNIAGVHQAVAKVESSPILGNLITVNYVGEVLPYQLAAIVRVLLPKWAVAKVYQVDSIELTAAGKAKR